MSKITNDDLTRSGTRCYITVPTVGVKGLKFCVRSERSAYIGPIDCDVITHCHAASRNQFSDRILHWLERLSLEGVYAFHVPAVL